MNTVKVTTPTHPLALAGYAIVAMSGFTFLAGVSRATALLEAWSVALYAAWAVVMMLSGITCLVAASITHRLIDPRWTLKAELYGCLGVGLVLTCYEVSLLQLDGAPFAAVTTQLLVLAIGGGSLWRAAQLFFELRRINESVRSDSYVK